MTSESTNWNIERIWSVATEDKTEQFRTLDLSRYRGVVMLGAAGAGKTTEAARLADQERASGASVHECRLAEFAETSMELADHLAELSTVASEKTIFYLDALDEAMIPARRRWLAIKHWVTGKLRGTGASIRITCRSAVWPSELTQVIRELVGERSFATVLLRPLSDDDILAAAASHGIDPVAFLKQIDSSGARSLAECPLSLRMLIRLHQSEHGLPDSLKDLFGKGIETLVSDAEERHAIGTQNPISPAALIEAAERLACYVMLAGRETLYLGDQPSPNQLGLQELSGKVTQEELRAIGSSGICDSTSPSSFRFGHRQFAEFLAGRRLARLPTHQVRAFLAEPDGWRSGVAGPLRETAAFTAMFNADVADWIATRDPEVIGLSDVADSDLRRAATLALLDRFRRGEMTDAQLRPGVLELKGLRYDNADVDLRPVLKGRGDGRDDVLECAIGLTRSWKLSSLSDDLADLALDSTAPLSMRVAAGYALRECGTATARARLKPLVEGLPEDEGDELKGIVLSCLWPDQLSTPELLEVLTARRRSSLYGAYASFLSKLDSEKFAAAGHLAAALRWAETRRSESDDTDVLQRIAMRIAQEALNELDDPVVARKLIGMLRHWAKHYTSPLAWLPEIRLEPVSVVEQKEKAPLRTNPDARRRLIDLLVRVIETRKEFLEFEHWTPGLRDDGDFLWLLSRACDRRRRMTARENYLHLARRLHWWDRPENLSAWLRVCDDEPVQSILGSQKSVDLFSEEAAQLRNDWELFASRPPKKKEAVVLDPPPRDRVLRVLGLAEAKDIRYFKHLCRELTLEPTSTHYGAGERFLTRTPGWKEADAGTRDRIIEVAKRYLSVEDIASEASSGVSPNSFHLDVMGAMWLLLECESGWLKSRGESWWTNWCWYILRELIPNMMDEPNEPKQQTLRLLNENSPSAVCREILALALRQDDEFGDFLPSLLPLLLDEPNTELDEKLCAAMQAGTIAERSATAVVEFVLTRASEISVPVCLDILNGNVERISETEVEHVAVSLLRQRAGECWHAVKAFLCSDEERGRRVLRRVADDHEVRLVDSVSVQQLGELAAIMIELFPPETDPNIEGAHSVTADESARTLRTQLISHLGRLEDAEAVVALRELEHRFGERYPWLRRPRSDAERAVRLSRWSPFPIDVIAEVMGADARRLIRSEDDAVDGIEYALEKYQTALIQDGGESPEDLWNTASGAVPSPKTEEHVSRKLCAVVRSYFRHHAVAADREVEIHRRSVGRAEGGEPGSEVDILVQVPGRGTLTGDAARVPIEVKLSFNDEAKTGIRTQLADRYMPQLGASHGVYVVVWMSLPRPDELQERHRPRWPSIEAARDDLRQEAESLLKEKGIRVRTVVVDGSLR